MPSRSVDLLGRSAELELIEAWLAGRSPAGPGLLLHGDRGVGKTALLDAAAARAWAAGMQVLRASGVKFEAGIRFSALHQLLYPLREHADRLATNHRDAVHHILGLSPGPPQDPLVASTAVLALLGEVAAERPLLITVDDVPWIDRDSATVLGFAVRRFGTDPILFLATAPTAADAFLDWIGLPEREIGPLAERAAAALLDTRWPGLAPLVRQRLLAEAAGNPLALLDLPAALTGRQRAGQDPLPACLPLPRRLADAFADEVQAQPVPTRHLLLLAALETDASPATIRRAAQGRADIDDLAPAQRANLVQVNADTGRLVFRHPLIRSAIVQATRPGECRSAHHALAAALDDEPDRQAWHLAEAAVGPDEAVAGALEDAARAASPSGGASAVVAALVRAAELSPRPADRSRRLVEAAYLASATGPLDRVSQLLADARRADDARQASDTPTGPILAAATAVYLVNDDGDIDAAHRLLARALDDSGEAGETTSDWYYGILHGLMFVYMYADRPELRELLGSALARVSSEAVTPLRLCYDAFTDPARTADTVRAGLARAFAALPADAESWRFGPLAYAALRVDALSEYRHLCEYMIERERAVGGIGLVICGLVLLSADSYERGQWDEAEHLARQGLDLAAAQGYRLLQRQLRCQLAVVAAVRGHVDLARTVSDEITSWAAPRGVGITSALARYARVIAALGQGDYEDAYVEAVRISRPGTPGPGILGPSMVLDLVEAAVHSGRTDQARAHVAAARQADIARISSRVALVDAGAAALAAPDADAGPLFEAALSLPDNERWPFEQARIQLAYGQWLRRTRDTTRARLHLRAAIGTLDRLGARPWAQRARNELRATGIPTTLRPDAQTASLTAQERQIAALAATGMTNKQIGQRLFLSPRTVSAHLHRVFPKLGIASRAALHKALEAITPDDTGPAPQSPTPPNGTARDPGAAIHR